MVRVSLFFLIIFFHALVHAEVTATLDRSTIYENETVNLELTLNSSKLFGSPDIDVLKDNFDILSQNKSSRSQWINGQSSAQTTWHYTLSPKQAGVFTIPSIKVGKHASKALTIQVKRVQNPGGTPNDIVFLEFEADKTQAKVQEQIRLTLRINYATRVSNLSLEELELNSAKVIEGQESQYSRNIGDRHYNTYEKVFFIYPEQSGELNIAPLNAELIIPRTNTEMMLGSGARHVLRTPTITIQIEPASSHIISADSLHIEESWSADPQNLKVGDSINRTITQKAQGALAERLDDIALVQDDAIRIYSEAPQFNNHIDQGGNTGVRSDHMAIVATKPGRISLPEVKVPWFNNQTQQQEEAVLPAIELVITGDMPATDKTQTAITSPVQSKPSSDTKTEATAANTIISPTKASFWNSILWPISTLLCLLIIAFLSFKLLKQKPAEQEEVVADRPQQVELAWRQLKKSCASSNANEVRTALLRWAKLAWPNQAVYALADIQRLAGSNNVRKELKKLDKALYQGARQSDYVALLQALEQQRGLDTKPSIYPTQ